MADKESVIRYVMQTPGNTNPAVLRSMLDDMGGSDVVVFDLQGIEVNYNKQASPISYSQVLEAHEEGKIIVFSNFEGIASDGFFPIDYVAVNSCYIDEEYECIILGCVGLLGIFIDKDSKIYTMREE